MDVGRYPTEQEGLQVLITNQLKNSKGPYMTASDVPRDPWGQPYRYRLIDGKPCIDSSGPDRKFGTEDDVNLNTEANERNIGCSLRR